MPMSTLIERIGSYKNVEIITEAKTKEIKRG